MFFVPSAPIYHAEAVAESTGAFLYPPGPKEPCGPLWMVRKVLYFLAGVGGLEKTESRAV
jgi:hypothetical protein